MMLICAVLFADDVQAIAGSSGWVGAGLLGLVLCWLLLKHLPDKDKQLKELLAVKDDQVERILAMKNTQLATLLASRDAQQKMMHEENQKQLNQVIEHCKSEMAGLHNVFNSRIEQLDTSIEHLSRAIENIPRSKS